jgi:branched-chain amino acid transport system substrate-binding protein
MTSTASKRSVLMGAAVAVGLSITAPAGAEELRIGYLAPLTGGLAQTGIDMRDGFLLYLQQHNNKLGGMDVKLIIEDEQGKGDVAVTKAKKLVLQDKVHMLIGGVLASTGYALAPVSTELKTLYIPSIPAADDLTQRLLPQFPYLIRTSWSSSQPHHPLGAWACEQGYKKIVTIAADYAFGYEVVGGFQKAFEDCGGQIVQKIWPPLGTKDFGPYIPTIKADADAVLSLMVAAMPAQFIKQLRSSGYKKPVLGGGTSYDEFVLPFMGDETIGDHSALHYSAALDTPRNAEFVKAYRTKFGKVPSYYSENNYTTGQMIDETIKKMGGKWTTPEEFIKVMQAGKYDTLRGPVTFDENRNPIQNIYIKKVEKKKMFGYDKEELWNTVIKTYPNVSQFWTYGREKFLAQPVYDKNFPPCKFC